MVNLIFHFNLYTLYAYILSPWQKRERERESRKLRYAIRANVLMSYELAMGFYRRSFYERYQPNDVYMYAYIYIHDVTAADVSRTHRRNGQHSNDEAISRCSISVLSHGKNLYSLFTSILGSTHFPRVIASLFYELLNGACWITPRRGRISRSSNKIIRLSRNYTSLSLSLVQFFVCPMFSIVSKRFYQRSFGIALSPPLLFRPCIIFSTFYSIKLAS